MTSALRSRAIRSLIVSCFALLGLGAAVACATEGDVDHVDSPGDAAPDTMGMSDAPSESDAGLDAGPCSDAGLCIVNAAGIDTRINVMSIAGSGAKDVWAVGSKRTVLHYDGAAWEKTSIQDVTSSPFTMRAVWVGGVDDVWIADGTTIRHGTGWKGPSATSWTSVIRPQPLSAISGKGEKVAIGTQGGAGQVEICSGWSAGGDGGPVDSERIPGFGYFEPHFLAMATEKEVWGSSLAVPGIPGNRVLRAYRASVDAGDADAAAETWRIEQHDSRFGKNLYAIWADADAVWLVGEGGALRRMTRERVPTRAFEEVESPVTADLLGVFGFGSSDVWAVGEDATVVHWDGTRVTKIATPFDTAALKPRLLSVWGSSPGDIWIGGNGVMLHYEGKATP